MNRRWAIEGALRGLFRIVACYVVAGVLFHAGMRMVLNLSGIHPGPVEWVTPVAEFSGAQFSGIWLGLSPVFQTIGGVVEVIAGLLLCFRNTTTLGAMLAVGCFTNSLMLHLCFRPNPWIADALMLLLSIYLVLLDWRMLVNLFLLDRATTPAPAGNAWEIPRTRKIGLVLKTCIFAFFIYGSGVRLIQVKYDANAQSALSGMYSVTSFLPSGVDLRHRWRLAAIDRYAERLTVRTMDGAGTTFQIQPLIPENAALGRREHVAAVARRHGSLFLVAPNGSVSVLRYSCPSLGRMVIQGELDGTAIQADMHRISPESLPLVNKNIQFAEPH